MRTEKIPKFYLNQKVIAKKIGWCGSGTSNDPIKKCDEIGTVISIKGMPNHNSTYEYKVQCESKILHTNGVPFHSLTNEGKLLPIDSEKNEHYKKQPCFTYDDIITSYKEGLSMGNVKFNDEDFKIWFNETFKKSKHLIEN